MPDRPERAKNSRTGRKQRIAEWSLLAISGSVALLLGCRKLDNAAATAPKQPSNPTPAMAAAVDPPAVVEDLCAFQANFMIRAPDVFRPGPFLNLASELQGLDRPARVQRLKAMAADPASDARLIVLCRMLFEPVPGRAFRSPMIGSPAFLDGSACGYDGQAKWPLHPIALFEGVPVVVVFGYSLGGVPESAGSYLDYCLTQCQERAERFHPKTADEIKATLLRFLEAHPALEPRRQSILMQH